MLPSHDLSKDFVIVNPELGAEAVTVNADFFKNLDQREDGFKGHVLMSSFSFENNWTTWEMHPAGDEVVVLLSGSVTFLIEMPEGLVEEVTLDKPGSYAIVPKGLWHTAHPKQPTQMLFFTPGEGTQNKPV